MKLYSDPLLGENKLWSYSPYDISIMKKTIHEMCTKFNENILSNNDEFIPKSVSSIVTEDGKNDYRVIKVTILSRSQILNNETYYNYSNNNRISAFVIDESISIVVTVDLPIIGSATCIKEFMNRRIRKMKCKLGWIKSVNISKVGI